MTYLTDRVYRKRWKTFHSCAREKLEGERDVYIAAPYKRLYAQRGSVSGRTWRMIHTTKEILF